VYFHWPSEQPDDGDAALRLLQKLRWGGAPGDGQQGCPTGRRTLANSAGTLRRPHPSTTDLVRVGWPVWALPCSPISVQRRTEPAIDVRARVTLIREVPTGELGVSYGTVS